eukprot:scaffold196840_cov13-Tisochrysis_lutea.AAC.1
MSPTTRSTARSNQTNVSHPPRIASHPPANSPAASSPPPQSSIASIAKLDGMFGVGESCGGPDSMIVEFGWLQV